ncbi:hypothetical protein K6327_004238 [Vibrio vulnificus]|nr:hypothetical protein [Vibrio vulnificus]EHU4998233.1 hypothetical protein [Vibrio vulnificus]EIA0806653.1 hypothetical protein [Vibrio vulnificus]
MYSVIHFNSGRYSFIDNVALLNTPALQATSYHFQRNSMPWANRVKLRSTAHRIIVENGRAALQVFRSKAA